MVTSSGKRKVHFGAAVGWASLLSWGQEGLAAASTFVLAFLLGPHDFGLVAIAMAYVGVFELFAAQGIVTAIVQSPEVEEHDLDSVFWYTLGCGGVLLVLAALFVLGLINALVHGKDAWAAMPLGLILSVLVFALAAAANWLGFSTLRGEHIR